MFFSRTSEYAVRAILHVASVGHDAQPVRVQEIAEALDIPGPSLSKIVQQLRRMGFLTSHKGPRGGVTLARPATKLTLFEVIEAVEGSDLTQRCIIGVPGCSERGPHCPLHDRWRRIRTQMLDMLIEQSIDEVAQLTKGGRSVLGRRPAARDAGKPKVRKPARRVPKPRARK